MLEERKGEIDVYFLITVILKIVKDPQEINKSA